jgi:hypothetical protein
MGSVLSGRYRTRNNGRAELATRLDMRCLRRLGFVRPGASVSGQLDWTLRGAKTGSVALAVDLRRTAGFAEVEWVRGGQPGATRQQIPIVGVPCRFGGHRYYFRCPYTGRRCEVLYAGGRDFAAREHHRLSYASQTMGYLDRLQAVSIEARERALGQNGRPRPRGANRKRLVAAWMAAKTAYEQAFASESVRRFGFDIS